MSAKEYYFDRYFTSDGIMESQVSRMFFAGLANSIGIFATHPLDVIKLNLQVKPLLSVTQIVTYYYIKDRGLTGFYKGLGGAMARAMINSNVRFEIYEFARRQNLLNSFGNKIVVSSVSGGLGSFIVTPISKVYVRLQNDDLLPPNERRYYKGLPDGLVRVFREEGFRRMYDGGVTATFRGAVSAVGQIALYDELKILLITRGSFKDDFRTYLVSSIAAGFLTSLLQQPFEVVCYKFMNAPMGMYKDTKAVIDETIRLAGIPGFYKGLLPSFLRLVPQTVVTYMILEKLRRDFGMLMTSKGRAEENKESDDNSTAVSEVSLIAPKPGNKTVT